MAENFGSKIMILLLLFSTAWGNPNPHSLQDEEDFFSTDKEVAVHGVSDQTMAAATEIKGRKMIGNKVIVKMVEIRDKKAANGKTAKVSEENQAVAMAPRSGNKHNNNSKKNKNRVGASMNGGNVSKRRRIGHAPDKKMNNEAAAASGFVAFNADYHAPRHHPPKNN